MIRPMQYIRRIRQSRTRDVPFTLYCIIFYLALIARDVFSIPIPMNAFSIYAVISFLVFHRNSDIVTLAMMLPFAGGLPMKQIVLLFVLVRLVRANASIRLVLRLIIPAVFLLALEIIKTVQYSGELIDLVYFAAFLLTGTLLFQSEIDWDDAALCLRLFAASTWILCALLFVQMSLESSPLAFLQGEMRLGTVQREAAEAIGAYPPETLALNLAATLSFVCILRRIGRVAMPTFLLVVLSTLAFGVLTQSWPFLACALLLMLACAGLSAGSMRGGLFRVVGMLALIAIGCALLRHFFPQLTETLLLRLTPENINAQWLATFKDYAKTSTQSIIGIFFGYGLTTYQPILLGNHTWVYAAQNALQETFLSWGLVGTILAGWWMLEGFAAQRRLAGTGRVSFLYWLPLVVFMMMMQTTALFRPYTPMLLLAFCALCIRLAGRAPDSSPEGAAQGSEP